MRQMSSILRTATRKISEPFNIFCAGTHERFESGLALTGHNFYAYKAGNIKGWNTNYAPVPDNYILLDERLGENQIPLEIDFDLVLSQNKFGQFQQLQPIAQKFNVPLVSLEHTLPMPQWSLEQRQSLVNMRGKINVFISEYSINEWGFEKTDDVRVIKHCVDSELFKPLIPTIVIEDDNFTNIENRENRILSVVNDWINRDIFCGFKIWQRVTQGLPVFPVGDTQGLSRPAPSMDELVDCYANSRIFINTSTISPIPTALLEGMSAGCACVSTATCMIPEVIEHGVNGFMTNDEKEMRGYLEQLMNDEKLASEMGKAARQTILDDFSVERFTSEWNEVFNEVIK